MGRKIMRIKHIVAGLLLFGLPALGLADTTNLDSRLDATQLPEPETLALLAIGAVGWAIARWAKRK
jgi:4-hydroxybenzoate polyprenyltransferase